MARTRTRINVNTSPVANQYAAGGERIVEFSSPGGGGLIAFRMSNDEKVPGLIVDVYRYDSTVTVRVGKPDA
jgi:hypothetical protein